MAPTGKYSSCTSDPDSDLCALSSKQTLFSSKSSMPIDSERSTLATTVVDTDQQSEITPWENGILNCIAKVRSYLAPSRRMMKSSTSCPKAETAAQRKQKVARMIREALEHASSDLVRRRAGRLRVQRRASEHWTTGESSESMGGISLSNIQSIPPDSTDDSDEEESDATFSTRNTLRIKPQGKSAVRTELDCQRPGPSGRSRTSRSKPRSAKSAATLRKSMRPKPRSCGKFQCRKCQKMCEHGQKPRRARAHGPYRLH